MRLLIAPFCFSWIAPFCLSLIVALITGAPVYASSIVSDEVSSADLSLTATQARPQIGLVLSGGGARGLAHVGVIKVLEEMKIPVDIVVGTSAGSAVGALYAMGLSIQEIEERLHNMDWGRGFQDEVSRDMRSFRRKQEDMAFSIEGSLGVDRTGLKLKSSLLQGQQLRLVLKALYGDANYLKAFDDLPRRYRALATDLETGKPVILDRGDISEAVLASMTIPAIYPPVEINGRLLVDGGMANNIPIDVARELGADIVIVVDISTPMAKRAELDSMLSIVDQLTNFLTRSNADKQLKSLTDQDILIIPELGDVTSADFSRSDEIVEMGATAARDAVVSLHTLSLEKPAWELFSRSKSRSIGLSDEIIHQIKIINNTDINTEIIRQRLRLKPGKRLKRDKLEHDLGVIYGLGYFESVNYRIIEENGVNTLIINADKRSWGPNYLRFSLDYQEDFDVESQFNVSTLFNMTELNRYGAEWSSSLQIGSEPHFISNVYQPLATNNAQYVSFGFGIKKENFNVFVDDDLISRFKIVPKTLFGALGQELGNNVQLEVGFYREEVRLTPEVGSVLRVDEHISHGYGQASIRYDSLQSSHLPASGVYVDIDIQAYRPELGDDIHSDMAHLNGRYGQSIGPYVINATVKGQVTADNDAPLSRLASLGGFGNLSGYHRNRFTGQDSVVAGIELYRKFDGALFNYYLGGAYEAGQVWNSVVGNDMHSYKDSVSMIYVADTFLGPVRVAASYADSDNSAIYFSIGKYIK